jgi:hypothetical protein
MPFSLPLFHSLALEAGLLLRYRGRLCGVWRLGQLGGDRGRGFLLVLTIGRRDETDENNNEEVGRTTRLWTFALRPMRRRRWRGKREKHE